MRLRRPPIPPDCKDAIMSRRWLLVVSSLVLCHTFIHSAVAQESTVHTLFGNWFGKKDNSSSQQDDRYNQRGSVRQSSDSSDDSARTSPHSQSNQMPPDPANGADVLPGLGGSPLPKKGAPPTVSASAAKNGTASQNASKTTPQNGVQRYGASNQPLRRSSSRQLNVSAPDSTPGVAPSTNATNDGSANSSSPISRQSPSHRTAPHVNPGDFRNELSGSFQNPVDTGEPIARTARADEHNSASKNAPATDRSNAAG